MFPFNMCMFPSRVDYDYAVRKYYENRCANVVNKQQSIKAVQNRREVSTNMLTQVNGLNYNSTSLNKE